MSLTAVDPYQRIYPHCCRALGAKTWGRVRSALDSDAFPETFPEILKILKNDFNLPAYIDDLARIEWACEVLRHDNPPQNQGNDDLTVNPGLNLIAVGWKGLAEWINTNAATEAPLVEQTAGYVLVWRVPDSGEVQVREARDQDFLVLKIVAEGIDPRQAAAAGSIPVATLHAALDQAVAEGLLLSPGSRVERLAMAPDEALGRDFGTAEVFTLQWHITQTCDLHCKHCYDRSDRTPMAYETALAILDDFYDFCRRMRVHGQVTFTGGNPLLYPHFEPLYQAAFDLGFTVAILGNPTPKEQIERIVDIAEPAFFQISLEGLAAHNDYIRGAGHFERSLEFLDLLRAQGIYSMVMLTLTSDNLDQVLPLGELLKGRTDSFTFNRLATVGEGAQLAMPGAAAFERFLRKYAAAAEVNPVLALKDNLLNIIRHEQAQALFGGCTGYGCGAAFNFVSLLADGEVHACRKFPSPIGNVEQSNLLEIYHSKLARQYREGSQACRTCGLRIACRGCLAVTYSHDQDIFQDRDPHCFADDAIKMTETYNKSI